ncbi:hypothetical protein HU755_21745 [Pseudomonas sp. SWRI111]|uniref:hypothetical protein n=1 Tax=Pseudomonas sp. SWRI111 TaxID=2745507 RepID=UPI001645DE70|nr:hypothetical protein [Pseudomonas sp. SWRI111]MBC3209432.1 hypothetical protein [Pseudomonas sp. SWRI111]
MAMVSEAFKNYLVEVTVMGIAKECEAAGMLSAAIHARHKVRKSDLESFFSSASKVDPDSWERKFYTYCLIVYASAAYEDVGGLISASTDAFRVASVKPHWAKDGKTYGLESVVYYEPLNLFPGLSTDNLSNNTVTIDQHIAAYYEDGTSSSLAMMSHQQRDKPTVNQITAKHMLESQAQSSASSTLHTPVKQAAYKPQGTPVSSTLAKDGKIAGHIETNANIETSTAAFDNAKTHGKKNNAARYIYTQVEKLNADARDLTEAGVQHYNNLLTNYTQALTSIKQEPDRDIEAILVATRDKWVRYRGNLTHLLAQFTGETKADFPLK